MGNDGWVDVNHSNDGWVDVSSTASPPDISSLGPQITPNPNASASASAEPSLAEQISAAELNAIPGIGPILNAGSKLGGAVGKAAEWLGVPHQTVQTIGENVSGMLEPETLMGVPGVGPIASGVEGLAGALSTERMLGEAAHAPMPAAAASPMAGAAERLGVSVPSPITSSSPMQQSVAAKLSQMPFAGEPLASASAKALQDVGAKIQDTGAAYGSGSQEVAGEQARSGIEGFIKTLSRDEEAKLYNKVDSLVPDNVTRPLLATQEAAGKIDLRRTNAQLPSDSKATGIVQQALATPGGLNYQGVKDLRTYVGGQLDQGLLSGPENAEMKSIYAGLTTDLRATVKKAGGDEAVTAWEDANTKAANMARTRQSLVRITGAKNDPGIVDKILGYASSTARGDIKQLVRVRDAVPPRVLDEIASTWVQKAAVNGKGDFSPANFVTAWNKLTPAGKRILFASTDKKKLSGILDDAATLSKNADKMQRYMNTSNTTPTAWLMSLPSLLWFEPMSTLSTVIGGRVLAHAWSKPATAVPTLNWVKAYGMAAKYRTAGSASLLAKASRALALSISKDLNIPQLVPRITQEIQGISPTQAQSQQNQGPGIGNQPPNQ